MSFELRSTQSGFAVWALASEPPFTPIPGLERRGLRKLFVFGSSVALGKGAKKNLGWVDIVRKKTQFSFSIKNLSVSGGTTATILDLLTANEGTLRVSAKDIAVVSLSLSNEGLAAHDGVQNQQRVAGCFMQGLTRIVARLESLGFRRILLATPYPCSRFDTGTHHQIVQAVIRDLLMIFENSLPTHTRVQIVDFYDCLRIDGTGKWLKRCRADDFHPNAAGHATMAALFLDALHEKSKVLPHGK